MNISETLNLAADHIERRGWISGEAMLGNADADPWGGGAASDAPVCLEGGIAAALGIRLGEGVVSTYDLPHCPAYKVVQEYLGFQADTRLYTFNDAAGRTAEEVIEVLRAAAVIEHAREQRELLTHEGVVTDTEAKENSKAEVAA